MWASFSCSTISAIKPWSRTWRRAWNKPCLGFYPGITIQGEVGGRYRVEYSETMVGGDWTTLTSLILTDSPFLYFDATATNAARRFYRVVGEP